MIECTNFRSCQFSQQGVYFLPVQSRHSVFTRVYITQLVDPERREGGREREERF